ncbi:MAG: prepilin peptidase [Actinomycetota bacterium]|nr:prepilin peptidase [Actinomycetota bacterium]
MWTRDSTSSALAVSPPASEFPLVGPAVAAGCAATATAAVATGHVVAAPVTAVAFVVAGTAIVDARTMRIPNRLIVFGAALAGLGAVAVSVGDHRPLLEVVGAGAIGWMFSGAPLMILLWVVRPASIGGGDWKLLTVAGITIGFAGPFAAALVFVIAATVQLVQASLLGRRRDLPLGPGLFAGYCVAAAAALTFNDLLGGVYQ